MTIAGIDLAPEPSPDQPRRIDLLVAAEIVVALVVAVVVATFVFRVQEAIGLTVTAACLAVLLSPLQRWFERWIGHVASMVATVIVSFAAAITGAYVLLRDLHSQSEVVAELLHERIDQVDSGSLAGRAVKALELNDAIDNWMSRIPNSVVVGANGGAGVGRQLVALLAVTILAVFFQSSGRVIIDWVVARWPRNDDEPDSPRASARRLLIDCERRGLGYVRRSIVLSLAVAVTVTAVCSACDIPGALLVGMWAGAWFVVPVIGPALGVAPLALLVWRDPTTLAWVGLVATVLIGVAALVLRKVWIERATMRLGMAPHVISVGLGLGMAGLAGSFAMFVIGAAACAILISDERPGRPTGWLTAGRHTRTIGGVTVPTGWRLAVLVAIMVSSGMLLWGLLHRIAPGIVWLIVGGFVAIAISRPVAILERRSRLSHQLAAVVVIGLAGLVLVAITVSGLDDGARATTTITEQLPEVVAELEDTQLIGPWLQERNAAVWVDREMNDLPDRLEGAQPEQWLPTIGSRLVDLFAIGVFAVALLVDGPRLVGAVERRVPARHRRQFSRLTTATGGALAGYAAGSALVAGINASVVFTLAVVLGVGLAPILATWAFLWNFVPQIGGFMGGAPLILFALLAGPVRGLVAGLAYFVYQFIENHVIQPTVIGAAIDVAPWGTLVAALVGAAAAGVIGAIVITPLVGVVRVVRAELARDDFPGTTVRVEPRPVIPSVSQLGV